jgi:nitrate reductase delta subunit
VSHIIARVAARLEQRGEGGAVYAVLLESLLMIAGQQAQLADLRGSLAEEEPDNTPEAIDKEWEETAVTFGTPDKTCGLDRKPVADKATPLHWVDAAAGTDPGINRPGSLRTGGM